MSSTADQDELAPSQTPGYKVGEKKTIDEYNSMDTTDESLKRWKASLGLGKSTGKQALENVKNRPFVIKEGVEYQMKEMIGSYGPSDEPYEKKVGLHLWSRCGNNK
ncbi:12295_t:CDS:2 [Racocetra fulgida]|uniref:12295_t:CDS:1 n=1 Tax=Racocetra fulgida TaxID=60492 RepID=A0A9N9HVN2_9GLOM|nr:12295_t:CDS:2 [Racocetra fulgida]